MTHALVRCWRACDHARMGIGKHGRWWMADRTRAHRELCRGELARYPEPMFDESAELRLALERMIVSLVSLGLPCDAARELCDIVAAIR